MVGAEHVGLDGQQVLRIAHVRAQRGRHLVDRLEQRRERRRIRADDGIGGVVDVEVGGAFVGVDDDLDRVAHVVGLGDVADLVGRLGIGVGVAGRVSVDDPVELAVRDHDVGVAVVAQKRRDRADTVDHVAPVQHLGPVLDLV